MRFMKYEHKRSKMGLYIENFKTPRTTKSIGKDTIMNP